MAKVATAKPGSPTMGAGGAGSDNLDTAAALRLLERVQFDVRGNAARKDRDRQDLLNLFFARGGEDNQWVVWDGSSNTYVRRPTNGDAGLPEWFFRATTNFFETKIDGIVGVQNQSEPAREWQPTKDDDRARAAAEVAADAEPVLLSEMSYPELLRAQLNKLVTLTDKAGLIVNYDADPRTNQATAKLPALVCDNCGALVSPADIEGDGDENGQPCPECGAGYLEPDQEQGQDFPIGKMHGEVVNSFELAVPRSCRAIHEEFTPWVKVTKRFAKEDAIGRWPKLKTILPNDEQTDGTGTATGGRQEQAYADQAQNLSAPGRQGAASHLAGNQAAVGPIITRLWHDPIVTEDYQFPDGLYLCVLEGASDQNEILECSALPYKDEEGRPFKNVLLRTFVQTGSAHGKPPADDLVPLQKQLNLCQSLAFLILMYMAAPRTWVPSTVTLLDKNTGVPGAQIGYRALVPGDKPVTDQGVGFPTSLQWFIEFLVQNFDVVSKLNAVLMGQRPEGDPTLGEVEILQERGLAAFKEPLEQLVAFENRLSLMAVRIAAQSQWAPKFRITHGENGEWDVKQFTGMDLQGHINVTCDPVSAWPKSNVLQLKRLEQALGTGMINPQDPEVQARYLEMTDLTDFKKSLDTDRKQVARHLDVWRNATDPSQITPPQPPPIWNVQVHLFFKTEFLKTEEAELLQTLNPEVYQAMVMHIQQLQAFLAPPPMPGEPGAGGHNVDELVKAGVLKPQAGPAKPGGPGKSVVDALARKGIIRPAGAGAAAANARRSAAGPSIQDLMATGVIRPRVNPRNTAGATAGANVLQPGAPATVPTPRAML